MHACQGCDQVVHQLLAQGWRSYEAPLPLLIARFVTACPSSVLLDVGANSGYYSLLAAVLGALQVRAYEPVPAIADLLAANVALSFAESDASRIQLHRVALADREGTAELFIPHQGHGLVETSASLNPDFRQQHSARLEVPLTQLDTHLASQPLPKGAELLLKLDVESCEPQVLGGAEACVAHYRPPILVEILPDADLAFYDAWLKRHDYRHYQLLPPNQLQLSELIHPSLQHRDHLFIPAERDPQQLFAS